jgi:hypothetical protein
VAVSRKARIALFFDEVYKAIDQVSLSPSSVRIENKPIGVSARPILRGRSFPEKYRVK